MKEFLNVWEYIVNNTYRLRVPGGWVIKILSSGTNWVKDSGNHSYSSSSCTFVPDPQHNWKIERRDADFRDLSDVTYTIE